MFPAMLDNEVRAGIAKYQEGSLAQKLAGAGGGGYLIVLVESPIEEAMSVKIRRRDTA